MMSTRQQLHTLVDMVDESGLDTLYNVMVRFIPEDDALPDEVEALKAADTDEYVQQNEINWQ
jgi:hypothetical protein